MRVISFFILLVAACALPMASAQIPQTEKPSAPEADAAAMAYHLRFTSFADISGSPGAAGGFVLVAGEWLSDAFSIPSNGFSRSVGAPVRSLTLALSDAAGALRPLGQIALPEQGRAFLVLLLPQETQAGGIRIVVIRADDPSFRGGDMQFFNLSDAPVGVKLQGERVLLQPRSHQKVSPPELAEGNGSYPVEFYSQNDAEPYLFAATQWVNQKRARTFVFTFQSPANGRMTYRAIDEFPSWMRKLQSRD